MGASDISMGQLLLTFNDIQQLINGIDVDASEILAHMTDVHQKNRVLLVISVLYLEAMNVVVVVCSLRQAAGYQSASVHLCLPMDLIGTSVVNFFVLVSSHKTQLQICFQARGAAEDMPAAQGLGTYCCPRAPAEIVVTGQDAFCVFKVVVSVWFLFP